MCVCELSFCVRVRKMQLCVFLHVCATPNCNSNSNNNSDNSNNNNSYNNSNSKLQQTLHKKAAIKWQNFCQTAMQLKTKCLRCCCCCCCCFCCCWCCCCCGMQLMLQGGGGDWGQPDRRAIKQHKKPANILVAFSI